MKKILPLTLITLALAVLLAANSASTQASPAMTQWATQPQATRDAHATNWWATETQRAAPKQTGWWAGETQRAPGQVHRKQAPGLGRQ